MASYWHKQAFKRLGLDDRITQVFTADEMIPAVGQGALAIECRSDDTEMLEILSKIDDEPTRLAVEGERSFLNQLNGVPSADGRMEPLKKGSSY